MRRASSSSSSSGIGVVGLIGCLAMIGGCGGSNGSPDAGTACDPRECRLGPLEPWQEPIADWLRVVLDHFDPDQVHRGIDDLLVFDDRMYLGYGDATLNTGRVIPTQIRAWRDPDAAPAVELADTTEEQIDHYRAFGDTLYVPGVDATEDAFLGNVFVRKRGGGWTRHRAVPGGVHVHDVAVWRGDVYAVGSGAMDLATWETGRVRSYLWRSGDGGATWTAAAEVPNSEAGDRRWIALAPFEDRLIAFGYRSNAQGSIVELLEDAWDGTAMARSTLASRQFVTGVEVFDESTAIVRGVALGSPLRQRTLVIGPGRAASSIAALAGQTVVDVQVLGPRRVVLLTCEGTDYPAPSRPGKVRVVYTEDLASMRSLVEAELDVWPTAVAFWRGAVYVGMADGRVWRAAEVR